MLLVGRLIAEVRRTVRDDKFPDDQRHKDDEIRSALYMALLDALRERPDMFLATQFEAPDPTETDYIDVNPMFMPPLVQITAGYLLMENSEHSQDGIAAGLIGLGRAQLKGV